MCRLTPAVYAEAVKRLEWGDGRQAVHHGSIPPHPSAHARVEQTSVLGCRRTRIARRQLTALRPCLSGTPQHPG